MGIHFVLIPGNHDCNFRGEGDARPALLEGVASKIDTLDPGGELVSRVTDVQDEFFSFEAAFRSGTEIPKADRLRYVTNVQIGEFSIVFDCYNTAWMSRKDEKQGTLLFPSRLLNVQDRSGGGDGHFRIALIHHRDNWLEANNSRLLRDHLDTSSDAILSGHEHVSNATPKVAWMGQQPIIWKEQFFKTQRAPGIAGLMFYCSTWLESRKRRSVSVGAVSCTTRKRIQGG